MTTAEDATVRVELAVAVKVPVVVPAGTITELGTVATLVFEDARVTVASLEGATDNVTVPVDVDPTAMPVGFNVNFVRAGCCT